jgi:hypothetical protein
MHSEAGEVVMAGRGEPVVDVVPGRGEPVGCRLGRVVSAVASYHVSAVEQSGEQVNAEPAG